MLFQLRPLPSTAFAKSVAFYFAQGGFDLSIQFLRKNLGRKFLSQDSNPGLVVDKCKRNLSDMPPLDELMVTYQK